MNFHCQPRLWLRSTLLALLVASLVDFSPAADPAWWTQGNPPVINGAPQSNSSAANLGQAKWMARSALLALEQYDPSAAAGIESELVGPGKVLSDWAPPAPGSPASLSANSPLLIGQLKALAAPFYSRLHLVYPEWLEAELNANLTKDQSSPTNYYPWTASGLDDQNLAMANIGQLKAVFALRFEYIFDSDHDGLRDAWEISYFGNLVQTGAGNPDGDSRNNLQEQQDFMDPTVVDWDYDSDGDGLRDEWENFYFGNLLQTGTGNPDGDSRNNLQEQQDFMDPTAVDWDHDGDGDGLRDEWEIQYFGNLAQTAGGNPDGDARNNLAEQTSNTDPTAIDWDYDGDGDGLWDSWEILYFGNLSQNATGNPDGDARDNLTEQTDGQDPTQIDWDYDGDGDGLGDQWELAYFGNLLQTGSGNPDGDARTNLQEYTDNEDPTQVDWDYDGDGDGLSDSWEISYFGNLAYDGDDDPDDDFSSNSEEYEFGTNPLIANFVDSDDDDMADVWEISFFGNLNALPSADADGDGVSNLIEFKFRTNPLASEPDSDGDGLWDPWELYYFGNFASGPYDNPDGDAARNIEEFAAQTNPSYRDIDWDGDGMDDAWELHVFGSISATAQGDHDGDSLTNLQEFQALQDTDADGMPDSLEILYFGNLNKSGNDDTDGDGLKDLFEIVEIGSSPTQADSNSDGISDFLALQLGLFSRGTDLDGDGLTAAQEAALGTSPITADTDGDGVKDSLDQLPLDPSRTTLVSGGTTVAPTITILSPAGAVAR